LYLKENARNILSSIRETIWLLNSKNLTVSGFTEGFINYCTNILRNFEGIEIEFREDIVYNKNLSPAVAINLLRILQEVIQNTVKHAKATKINCFIENNEQLTIIITDNGKGFDISERSYGNGLKNMKYRAAEIYFDLTLNSGPGKGTEIKLTGKV
jgi:signal transduction histidine kinase